MYPTEESLSAKTNSAVFPQKGRWARSILSLAVFGATTFALVSTIKDIANILYLAPLFPLAFLPSQRRLLVMGGGVAAVSALYAVSPIHDIKQFASWPMLSPALATVGTTLMALLASAPVALKKHSKVSKKPIASFFPENALGVTLTIKGKTENLHGDIEASLGTDKASLIGRSFIDRVHLLDRVGLLRELEKACQGKSADVLDIRLRREHAGETVWRNYRCYLEKPDQNKKSARATLFDTAELAALKGDNDRLQAQLETQIGASEAIVANISHKLRNSLTAILGYSELLQADTKDNKPEIRDAATTILKAGEEASNTLDAIVEYGRLIGKKSHMRPANFSWQSVLGDVESRLAQAAADKGVKLDMSLASGIPDAFTDHDACLQAITNIVSNAILSSPRGESVRVHIRQFGRLAQICISNKGAGLSKEASAHLNKPQSQTSATELVGAGGFSLHVSKELVAALGGQILCENPSGGGSKITLRVPLQLSQKPNPSKQKISVSTVWRGKKTVDDKGENCARLSA